MIDDIGFAEPKEVSPLMITRGTIKMYKDNKQIGDISLEDIEPISNSSFG
jgi:hypothetical protein